MEKIFCPACGNNTLWRIPVAIDKDGTVTHFHNHRRRINIRGTKVRRCFGCLTTQYPIPLPKGGRQNHDIILTEDEWQRQAKIQHQRKGPNLDVMDPDFSFGSKLTGKHQDGPVVGYGRKNPNVAKKKVGKKNKTKMDIF